MDAFTPRKAAKFVVTQIIRVKTAKQAESLITDYTQFEEDDLVVDITTGLLGWWVSSSVKPYTDKMVDKTADFIIAKREQMKDRKKDTPEEQ